MYYLIPVFLFSFSANIDSFIIGISYGLRKTEIRPSQNLFIASITLCGTIAALLSGSGILKLCTLPFADSIGSLILLALGIYYLLKFLISTKKCCHFHSTDCTSDETCCHLHSTDCTSDKTCCHLHSTDCTSSETCCHLHSTDCSSAETCCRTFSEASASSEAFPAVSTLSWKEALLLGISLSANNLGIGIGASIAGLHVLPTAPVSFLLSMLFLYLGNLAGKSQLLQKAGHYADLFCGLLLIILGICQ